MKVLGTTSIVNTNLLNPLRVCIQNKIKESDVLMQGLALTIIGMSVVFIILLLLVYVMKLLSFVVFRFFPEKEEPAAPRVSGGEAEIAAVIAAAYAQMK